MLASQARSIGATLGVAVSCLAKPEAGPCTLPFLFILLCSVAIARPCIPGQRRKGGAMGSHQTSRQTLPLDRLAYRVKEAADALAISRSRFYELVAAGRIRVLKDGVRTLVRRSELEAYLDRLEEAAEEAERKKRGPSPTRR